MTISSSSFFSFVFSDLRSSFFLNRCHKRSLKVFSHSTNSIAVGVFSHKSALINLQRIQIGSSCDCALCHFWGI